MTDHVRVAVEAGVMSITLARPEKKNALSNAMYGALVDALQRAEQDADVRVVLFEAEGDVFTAGNDLADFASVAIGAVQPEQLRAHEFLGALARGLKPYVAAVQGRSVGIGLTWLLHCDLVYVAHDAVLTAPFVDLALVPEAASSWLLPARIGHARAYAIFCLGEPIDGRTAEKLGLANAALPADEVKSKARAAALALSKKPLGSLIATKQLMRDAEALVAVMKREGKAFGARLQSAEAAEAFRAFAERRPPDFTKIS
jgi:enoyl-CoA hydratase/carnithine racemase